MYHWFTMHEARTCLSTLHWASIRDVFVTHLADDHRFALAGSHKHHPSGLGLPSFHLEVFQSANMMHLTFSHETAVFTGIC
jgi:hypothetical protein